jgi:cytochrome c556
VVGFLSCAAFAHQGASGIVLERMQIMKTMERELKAILQELAGQQPPDAKRLNFHIQALYAACGEIGGKFPQGSSDPHSHALPAVWERPEEFARMMQQLHERSGQLAHLNTSSAEREALLTAAKAIGAACQHCHETFRKPQDELN